MTDDQFTAELDEITNALQYAALSAGTRPWTLRNELPRLVIDPERFPDEREELNRVGRGAVCTCTGRKLREEKGDTRKILLDNYFHP